MREAATGSSFVILDTPPRQQKIPGLTPQNPNNIRKAMARGVAPEVAKLITPEIIRRYQIAGAPEVCIAIVKEVMQEDKLISSRSQYSIRWPGCEYPPDAEYRSNLSWDVDV